MTDQQLRALTAAMDAHHEAVRLEVATIVQRLEMLTDAVASLTNQQAFRLSRAEVCDRQGIHRNTLLRRLQTDRGFPRPGPDGKWALSDLMRWELANTGGGAK